MTEYSKNYKVKPKRNDEKWKDYIEVTTLFAPNTDDIRRKFPELWDVQEFKDLKPTEMSFVWHYKIGSHANENETVRYKISQALYFSGHRLSEEEHENWTTENGMPDKIKNACKRMEDYSASYRMIAAQGLDKTFRNLVELQSQKAEDVCFQYKMYKDSDGNMQVATDKDGKPIKEFNIEEAKKFAMMIVSIQKEMAEIIKLKETNYGVSRMTYAKEGTKMKPITIIKKSLSPRND